MPPEENEPTQPSMGALLEDWPRFRAEDREWKAATTRMLRTLGRRQIEQRWQIRALKAQHLLAAVLRSRAPELVAAVALVGIAIALFAR